MGHREAQAVLDDHRYTSAKKFLLYRIANLVNPHNNLEYWQRPDVVAEEVEVTPNTVSKYMREFVKDGWFIVVEQGVGRGNHSRYRWIGPPAETNPGGLLCDEEETNPENAETNPSEQQTNPGATSSLYTNRSEKKEKAITDLARPYPQAETHHSPNSDIHVIDGCDDCHRGFIAVTIAGIDGKDTDAEKPCPRCQPAPNLRVPNEPSQPAPATSWTSRRDLD